MYILINTEQQKDKSKGKYTKNFFWMILKSKYKAFETNKSSSINKKLSKVN